VAQALHVYVASVAVVPLQAVQLASEQGKQTSGASFVPAVAVPVTAA